MLSVGIDISKSSSMVSFLKPYGELVKRPYPIRHTKDEISGLIKTILAFEEEVKVVMEFTATYHLPVLYELQKAGIFVTMVNPLTMYKYSNTNIRPGKTDIKDSLVIANYGIDNWYKLQEYTNADADYEHLRTLSRQYNQYISMRVKARLTLVSLLDKSMPGVTDLFENSHTHLKKDKLNAFTLKYWHYDNITKLSEKQFIHSYQAWANKEGYVPSHEKAVAMYALAKNSIPTVASDIPSTKMLISEAIRVYREINTSIELILTQMQEIAKNMKEYKIPISMKGIGEKLAPRFIAEVGDVKRFKNASCLIAYAGIDAPPYQSGCFSSTNRHISKRGSRCLRKVGYEVVSSFKRQKPADNEIYLFMLKKESEGKAKKVAKIAGLNKLFRIYYARVNEAYN